MNKVSQKTARKVGHELKVNFKKVDINEFTMGLNSELEHSGITGGDLALTGLIALDHLKELPDYYTRLKKMET